MNAPFGPNTVESINWSHPPRSSVVNTSRRAGWFRSAFAFAASAGWIGRKWPTDAKIDWASGVCRNWTNASAIGRTQWAAAFLSTTTVGVWIRTVEGGSISTSPFPPAAPARTWFS